MLNINITDVLKLLQTCVPQLIFFAVVLVLAIIAMVVCMKMKKKKKYIIRTQAGIAIVLALVITVNMVCFGPMTTIITLATGKGTITKETSVEAETLNEKIADEGIVLLKNDDNALPLQSDSNINVFGWASTNPCYGGTGSGSLSDAYPTVSLLQGLENSGFKLNTELSDFYTSYRADRPEVGMWAQDWTLPEPPVSTYTDQLITDAKDFSDTAMVVITRVGGEGADLPTDLSAVTFTDNSADYKEFPTGTHYLELSQSEKDMVDLVCSNFDNVIVVYNGANAMELGFTKDYPQIKGLIWCPGTGQSGFNSLGSILNGTVDPSGKTADTLVADLTAAPYYNNIGNFTYDNMSEFSATSFGATTSPSFVDYVEGIYVGYRYYETAATEGTIDYDKTVVYPFGYGLSYTSFTQTMGELKDDGKGNLTVDVTVTNTGNVAGKDVVELYYNPPYTNGGIEKASANLVGFDKTDSLDPGASQTLTLSLAAEDMASYDTTGTGSYVLEAGDYKISIRSDSHNIITEKTYNVPATIVYGESNQRSSDSTVATNEFSDAAGDVVYLSRANKFENYSVSTAKPASLTLSDEAKATFINNSNYDPTAYNNDSDVMPTTGADNGVKLADLRGADYNDAKWDTLLDELTVSDMVNMIALGGYQTAAMTSVDKVATIDCDGPASINNNFTGVGSIGFPSAVMIACTWNEDMAREFGKSIGTMADEMGVSGWYAPAMNIHRSAFAGRNFEYYSEDGLLSGKIAANAVSGAKEMGVYAYVKHFALNDQETNRCNMLCTWANEQSIREIYLKSFELAVKEGGANAVMSSFNFIGTTYAGASDALLNKVLRDEWGFKGFVLTDYYGVYGYQDADREIRNGNDLMLVNYATETSSLTDTTSATSVLAMRQSSKNVMYTVVNSRAYDPEVLANSQAIPAWKLIAYVIDILLAGGIVLIEVMVVAKGYKRRAEEE